ncbi:MAG: sodium:alanine symporter family protein [Lachnospiraceae bacterium]|nr:sodium:alanine symporter family protein [Lachnospiraceae bacterium]
MDKFSKIVSAVDGFVWGPVMLILLVGTGVFLTIRTGFLPWRNLGYALKSTLSKEARKKKGTGDVSPFSALTTALAATIGTGNIVGVATAMVSGGPGALVWMWISACFGLTSKFSECMLAIKYREVNEKGEMSGGPMYTMKKALKHKKFGRVLGWLFAFFAVVASFGIGNMTQANSISSSIHEAFGAPTAVVGIVITVLALLIIVGGIKTISKVSSVVVPLMAIFYVVAGLIVIFLNIQNVPSGMVLILKSAFNFRAVSGGVLGTVVASFANAMRYGVARGVFSNEAGMGSAAITAAAATTDNPVRQGYINMTGTFWDTIVVCTITGLCIASSGVLGSTHVTQDNTYSYEADTLMLTSVNSKSETVTTGYAMDIIDDSSVVLTSSDGKTIYQLTACSADELEKSDMTAHPSESGSVTDRQLTGAWRDADGNIFKFNSDGTYCYEELYVGSALTIQAFSTVLGKAGAWLVTIGIALFAFSTILGWEYHGEKAFEYLLHTHKFNIIYRIIFSLIAYIGATTTLDLVWNLSDIANALMAIPNLICLLALSGEIASDMKNFQPILKKEQALKKAAKN